MNVWRNKMMRDSYFKKLIIRILCFVLFSFLLFGGLFIWFYHSTLRTSNQVVNALASSIRSNYPNVTDEDILDILEHSQSSTFFDDYGIDINDTSIVSELQHQQQAITICFISLWIFLIGGILYFLFWYFKKNQLEIQKIVKLIDDVNHKIYTISLEEHNEGIYGILQSELYKTTIMLKEQAENSEIDKQALKTALSDISHQIKTPLTSILIMLDTLTDYPDMPEEQKREFLDDIRNQIQRIHFLTMSMLKVARLDSGVVQFKKKKIQGSDLIESVLTNLEMLSLSKNLSFEIDGSLTLDGDFPFLEEAFMNILKNCIEASFENGKIFIHMEENPFYSKFVIKDEGIGIERNELAHIFDRFFKSQNAKSDSIGIGLNLSKKIIEGHHGIITCTSDVGKGTTFEIKFMKNM